MVFGHTRTHLFPAELPQRALDYMPLVLLETTFGAAQTNQFSGGELGCGSSRHNVMRTAVQMRRTRETEGGADGVAVGGGKEGRCWGYLVVRVRLDSS